MMSLHQLHCIEWEHLPKDVQNAIVRHIPFRFFSHGDYKMAVAFPDDLFRACAGGYPEFYEHGADAMREKEPW